MRFATHTLFALLLLLVGLSEPAAGSSSNLLINGGFDEPVIPIQDGYHTYGPNNHNSIPGWTITRNSIDVVTIHQNNNAGWQHAPGQGNQSIDLNGTPGPGGIKQTIATEIGHWYIFSGWVSHHNGVTEAGANVTLNNQLTFQLHAQNNAFYDALGSHHEPWTPDNMHWKPFEFRFKATSTSTTLDIEDRNLQGYDNGGTALAGLAVYPILLPTPDRVLVIENTASADSVAITQYYQKMRGISDNNICRIHCSTDEEVDYTEYIDRIRAPIQDFLISRRQGTGAQDVDFIVLTKGVPIRLKMDGPAQVYNQGYNHDHPKEAPQHTIDSDFDMSIDSMLATLHSSNLAIGIETHYVSHDHDFDRGFKNPYFHAQEPFSSNRFGIYMVTRLDGYTRDDCYDLVNRSLLATPAKGDFVLFPNLALTADTYKIINYSSIDASDSLQARGFNVLTPIDNTSVTTFPSGDALIGYFSYGTNDHDRFSQLAYNNTYFIPGGLAETAVSTSARTFTGTYPFIADNGQTLIADLISQGATGCKGFVTEPAGDTSGDADNNTAHVSELFDRYTSGYTLGESYLAASPYVHWKDIIIGDPLCAPYDPAVTPPPVIKVTRSVILFDRSLQRFVQTLTLTNTGLTAIDGPISLAFGGLHANDLRNASGLTNTRLPAGNPYISVISHSLAAGASAPVRMVYSTSTLPTPGYTPRVLTGPGSR